MISEKRSGYIISLIAGITVVPLVTLLWLGWRLLDQDRMLEEQQIQERVELAADLIVAEIEQAVSDSERKLVAEPEEWPEGAVAIVFENERVRVYPKLAIAYVPVPEPFPEAPAKAFAVGEQLEFLSNDPAAAIDVFREAANSDDPALRAGALLRLGRNLSKSGRIEEALAAYEELSGLDDVLVAGVPADLTGRYARLRIFEAERRAEELQREAETLATQLRAVRWELTAPVYWLYLKDADHWRGVAEAPVTEEERFAEVLKQLWQRREAVTAPARESIAVGEQSMTVLRAASEGDARALIVTPEFVDSQWLAAVVPQAAQQNVSLALSDTAGRIFFGATRDDEYPSTNRLPQATSLPWTIVATSEVSSGDDPTFARRRQLLIAGFALLVLMACTASYLIFRDVNRERALARMQSEFVAAVSHEFRTPLTALHQFTDMLREKTNLDEERRRVCYEALGGATDRLTRLVESLLDFGRMEAGAHSYTLETLDCTKLVRNAVEEFRVQGDAGSHDVHFHGNGEVTVDGDPEALSRALHNLLDNAVKYSPGGQEIHVGLETSSDEVRISIKDDGIGIPADEREAILTKFKRGDQARARGIRGTGIGLAMVVDIVRAHHGRLLVESTPGQGSTFTIILPLKTHEG